MATDPARQAQYDALRKRFLSDPDFRAKVSADPVGTLTAELGELTDDERAAIDQISGAGLSDADLVERLNTRSIQSW